MPKVHDPIPSRSFSVAILGDDLESLNEIVQESRRLKPEWHDTPQSVLHSIIEDFLAQADAFDQFVLTRVDTEQRELLRKIAELKGLKRAARSGTLQDSTSAEPADAEPTAKEPEPETSPVAPPPLSSVSSAVR